jgi:hypothetical protein
LTFNRRPLPRPVDTVDRRVAVKRHPFPVTAARCNRVDNPCGNYFVLLAIVLEKKKNAQCRALKQTMTTV